MKAMPKKCFRFAACCILVIGVCLVMGAAQVHATIVVVQNNPADLSELVLGTPSTLTTVKDDYTIEINALGYRDSDQWLYALQLDYVGTGTIPNTNSGIIGINPATGAITTVDSSVTNLTGRVAAGDFNGNTMYIVDDDTTLPNNDTTRTLYSINFGDTTNGVYQGSLVGSFTGLSATTTPITGTNVGGGHVYDYDWYNGNLWGADTDGHLVKLNPGGTRTEYTGLGLPAKSFGAAWVDPNFTGSVFLYNNQEGIVYRIDDLDTTPTFGASWNTGVPAITYNDGTWMPRTLLPIPGAVWLLGSGFIGLMAIRRRFKK
jgi:hypothetical protein